MKMLIEPTSNVPAGSSTMRVYIQEKGEDTIIHSITNQMQAKHAMRFDVLCGFHDDLTRCLRNNRSRGVLLICAGENGRMEDRVTWDAALLIEVYQKLTRLIESRSPGRSFQPLHGVPGPEN